MVILLLIIFVLALNVSILFFDAYLFAAHVPTLVADPGNWGAWVWLLLAILLLVFGFGASRNIKVG